MFLPIIRQQIAQEPDLSRREKSPVFTASISAISIKHFSAFEKAFLIASFGNSGNASSRIIYSKIMKFSLQIDVNYLEESLLSLIHHVHHIHQRTITSANIPHLPYLEAS